MGVSDDRWPGPDDDLLKESGKWRAVALLAFGGDSSHLRATGFRRAAELVAQQALAHGEQDFLVYPVGFLYRHALELYLKRLIVLGSKLQEQSTLPKLSHDLKQLWATCRPFLKAVEPEAAEYDDVGRIVDQLASLDPKAESFRYHETTKREPTLTGVEHLDLQQFSSVMDGVLSFMEGCESQILEYLGVKSEMDAEYREFELQLMREFQEDVYSEDRDLEWQ